MDDTVDEGCEADIKVLHPSMADTVTPEISLRITPPPPNSKDELSPGTDLSCSPRSDSSEGLMEGACGGGGRISPGALQFTSRPPLRLGRSPRRKFEDESYVYSVSQNPMTARLGARRRSDPGRVSVSPLRCHVRVDCDISEDGDFTEDSRARMFRLNKLGVASFEESEEYQRKMGWRPRSRSPHLLPGRVKTLRSQSLPGADPAITEIGEAIGAIAITKPDGIKSDLSPEDALRGSFGERLAPRRRRSVSVECSSHLEAIVEDSVENDRQKSAASRRFSTPAINIT